MSIKSTPEGYLVDIRPQGWVSAFLYKEGQ